VSLTSDILDLRTIHLQLYTEWNNLQTKFNSAAVQCDAGNFAGLATVFRQMEIIGVNIRALYMGASPSMRNTTYDILHYIDLNLGSGYTLTLQKMLDAIWAGNKLESFHFINYIDAMRASIWNVEIYETHLAEWYRHFSL